MKKIFITVLITSFICGCSKTIVDYSFFVVDKATTYVMGETEETVAEFESENSNLIKDYNEEEKQLLYQLLAPSLTLYAEGENIFSCYFDYGSIYDAGDIEEQSYVISEQENTLTVHIRYYSESDVEYKYVFEIVDEHTLKYSEADSSEFRGLDEKKITLTDGAVFVCDSEGAVKNRGRISK